jgi:hypothetical protein
MIHREADAEVDAVRGAITKDQNLLATVPAPSPE